MNHTETMNDRQRELFTVACDALAAAVRVIRPPHSALYFDKDIRTGTTYTFGSGYAEVETKLPSGDTLVLTVEVKSKSPKLESE